ncbi:thaumatin-like protein [Acaromyces ingoldii]|uniref:Thaumatin-like protein n=1 Tax=Acaromyces ingoldii TaxID=215250 RepID=A0A316YRS6_9BASI|nr:thaumatin-like protein [Acaromyces ingoldii]PWN91941.1 thaumatin-like protein [Acaromyces ingoldii]
MHFTPSFAVLAAALFSSQALARTFTIHNNCPFTIWPAVYTGNTANGVPGGDAAQGGWELASQGTSQIPVPDAWTAGRFWARTECDFSKQDVQSCATGSCIGGLHCTQPGIPPVTLAEFTLASNVDNYDSSLVDGSNLPISITANGCPTANCPFDLNSQCPGDLQLKDAGGAVVGCKSSCLATGRDDYCCAGAHNTPATCPSSNIPSYNYFKSHCPNSYAYAYDESSGTALWTCSSGSRDYTITFCP